MQLSLIARSVLTLALCFAWATTARADIQVVQTVHLAQTLPTGQQIPQQQRAAMAQALDKPPYQITTLSHGKITRLDYGQYFEIATPGQDAFKIVDPRNRSYLVQHFTYFHDNAGVAAIPVTMKLTSKTRTIAGHRCKDYHLTGSPKSGAFAADLWVAKDIPNTPGPMAEAVFNGVLLQPWPSIKGLPLEVNMKIGTSKSGMVMLTIKTDSITATAEPEAMFIVPKTYTETHMD